MEPSLDNLCHTKFLLKPPNFKENEKIDVVATSLFRMEKGYKYFEKYMRGLQMAVSEFTKRIPEIKFLLFVDDSIALDPVLLNRIKKMNNGKLIIIHFSCPIGLVNKGRGYHIELFGTLVRFLPFFKYKENFTRNVICIDADIDDIDLNQLIINYNIFKKAKSQYQYDTNMFYEILAKWSLTDDYTIVAGRHMCKYKFPFELLIDYIDCVRNQTCDDISTIKSLMDYNKYNTFPYGIDEYFLNHILLPYMKNHKITYSASVRYVITAPLYYLNRQNTIDPNSDTGLYLRDKLSWVLGQNNNTSSSYKELVDKFDQIFYPYVYENQKNISEYAKLVAVKYYDFILELWKTENYQIFKRQTLKKILNASDYIYKHNIIVHYGSGKIKKYLFPNFLKIN
ncbi:putative ORFan [Tupanvirus deep ocean]|uniref:ORFan n=2 Tax=Tupanvirus TaxID=2094720 RepID=A0AC62A9J1_9VIRU|nr:putative ORFan [Tupanvirus deep ocean]QKU34447.1 putative ORFan [Tupanvirus deep ocean]